MAAVSVTMRDLHLVTSTEDACRQWLKGRGLLAANMQCPHCNTVMQERTYNRVLDGVVWRCPSQQCRATVSVRRGSFFQNSNLPLTKLTDLICRHEEHGSRVSGKSRFYRFLYRMITCFTL